MSGNFAQYLPLVIGSVNITIGVFTTIQQYFKISEYNENFRICARAWDKYAREIQLELSKFPGQRKECGLFLKKSSEEFERLMETTPDFPDDIIKSFTRTFNTKDSKYSNINKPRIIEGINETAQIRNKWYIDNDPIKIDNESEIFTEFAKHEEAKKQIEKIVNEQLENILKVEGTEHLSRV
jgi:hypothetical protein